ncbi:Hypothetical predicted protein [Octopus vulgaris]|uniref:Uncharacterized protein n=1 Tax=Octopus vulgaris TaxID=6645 RepID=A0AA36BSW3_OCTVU|nr:Hypothetical predicted protein [Octopus vulgaris]
MIEPVSQNFPDPQQYVHRLRTSMSQVSPSGPRQQNVVSRVPKDINTWTHVFVRNDGIPSQLRPPYSGPYKVIKREPKYFVLDIGGKRNTVSIDRLKKLSSRRTYIQSPLFLKQTRQLQRTPQILHNPDTPNQEEQFDGQQGLCKFFGNYFCVLDGR